MIVAGIIAMYLVVGGFTMIRVGDHVDYGLWDDPGPFFAGVFWPAVVPWYLGMYAARTPERRRQRALEQARRLSQARRDMERRTAELEKSELGVARWVRDIDPHNGLGVRDV